MTATSIRLTGLDEVARAIEKLPDGIAGKGGGIARKALRKAAKILEKSASANLQQSINAAGRSGITDTTGFTAKQVRTKVSRRMLEGARGEAVYVTVQYKPHPTSAGKYRKRPIHANDIAFLLEVGAKNIDPLPWMRPAFLANAPQMLSTIESSLVAGVDALWLRHYGTPRPGAA